MKEMMKRLFRDEEGQGLVEYGLIIALVAIALIAGLTALAGNTDDDGLKGIFKRTTSTLDGATTP